MNFGNGITEIHSIAQALPVKCSSGSDRMRFTNCGNQVVENGRKKKLWLPKSMEELKKKCYVHNIFTTFL